MTRPDDRPPWLEAVAEVAGYGSLQVLASRRGMPHVIAVTRDGQAGTDTAMVVKRCASGRDVVAATALRAVGRSLERSADAPLRVPTVLAWRRRLSVLCLSVATGEPLRPALDTPRQRGALDVVARAMACLHGLPVRAGTVTGMADHLRDLIPRGWRAPARTIPGLEARVDAVGEALRRCPRSGPAFRPVPIHRDVHARQMYLESGRIWLLDWDVFARGDAALDVANFAVYLRTHLADGTAAAATFLDSYARHGDARVLRRVGPFEALTALRLTCKAVRTRPPGWRQLAMRRLADAERALARC